MSKYSSQFKFNVVQDYLKLGGLKKLAKQYSINTSDIRNWTLTFQANGLPGLQKRSRQRYTLEFKIAVLKFMKLNLISARPAAAHFNIAAPSTITCWRRFNIDHLEVRLKTWTGLRNKSETLSVF
jgi:transposase